MERLNSERANISFKRLTHEDLPRIHRWLHTPHVAKWWYEDLGTLEEVSEKYGAYITGEEAVEPYLILSGETPIGYIQSYLVSIDEDFAKLVGIPNAAGVDVFIGEEEFLYRGLGAVVIRGFIEDVVFADGNVSVCIIDPEPTNHAAIRAYEKVGFRHFRTTRTSYGPAYLMELGREEFVR